MIFAHSLAYNFCLFSMLHVIQKDVIIMFSGEKKKSIRDDNSETNTSSQTF